MYMNVISRNDIKGKEMKMGKYDMPFIMLDLDTGPQTFGLKMEYRYCKNCKEDHFVIRLIGANQEYRIQMDMDSGGYVREGHTEKEIKVIDVLMDHFKTDGTYNMNYLSFMYENLKFSNDLRSEALQDHGDGNMLEYCRVMGVDDLQYLSIDDKDFVLMDAYCVTPNCICTDVALDFFDGFNRDKETPSRFSFLFDYETGEVKKSGYLKKKYVKNIAMDFDEEIRGLFKERHKKLKKETKHLFKSNIENEIISGLKITKKTGRNDPCPCGSGKKFKKCCLPKQIGYT